MDLITKDCSCLEKLDFLILSTGSDFRTYEILKKYLDHHIKIGTVIFLCFQERHKGIETGSDGLFNYQKLNIDSKVEISCQIRDPGTCLDGLLKHEFNQSNKIGMDISCMTKPYFYFLLKLLKERFGLLDLIVYYTEPQSYLFKKGLFNSFHSSYGPLSILEIPGFSGEEKRGSKRSLFLLLGFDGDLSREINEDVSPSETIVVNGFPSYTPKFKDISLIANEKLVSDQNIDIQYSRANNPFEIYNLLNHYKNEKAREFVDVFINIAPIGTKPMALGACLFALHNPDVRVVYPLPENYENKYTDKCWNTWRYILPLSLES